MKSIIIILILSNLVGCAIQPISETTAGKTQSNNSNQMLSTGTWEGISRSGGEFKVLKIMANGEHSLSSYNISSGMQFKQTVSFENKDVSCDAFNCHIFTYTADEKLPLKITLTKFVDKDFLVTEAIKLVSEEIGSNTYKLKLVEGKTTPERFIAQEAKKMTKRASQYKNTRFGYWSGIVEISNDDELKFAILDYQADKVATFTVYTPGLASYPAKMHFKPEWLKQSDGELSTKLAGAPFASEITLRYPLREMIDGAFQQRFERYPERLINSGNFRLYRVRSLADYKPPEWLETFLKSTE